LKNNICYKSNNCNYYNEVSGIKYCLSTCNVGEGFLLSQDSENPKRCYSSCDLYSGPNKYVNHGENICMGKCSITDNSKIYRKSDEYECFSSCKEIDDGTFIYEIKDSESGDIVCNSYSSFNTNCLENKYFITKGDGVKKCVEEDDCFDINYKYLKGKECLGECNNYIGIDAPGSLVPVFINCFEDFNECYNEEYKYYNINEKKCWKDLPTGYCKISNSEPSEVVPLGDNYNYYDNDGLCVTSCKGVNKYIDYYDKKNVYPLAKKMITQIFFMSL
jgi:hypothetical protein